MKNILLFILGLVLLAACGDPAVDVLTVEYEAKIAVEGYVYPGEQIKDIILTRNFRLEQPIDTSKIILFPAENEVVATINGTPLMFDPISLTYYSNITAEYNTSYELVVKAKIDGRELETSSVTTTPAPGFDLVQNNLGDVVYRSQPLTFGFSTSPGTDFYTFSIRADNPTLDNFIYDNPYIPNLERKDVEDAFNDYRYQYNLLLNVDSYSAAPIGYEILGLDTWFYTSYTVIVYAGDRNFKDYLLTAKDVQQPDGNFVEPKFHFSGDGIGIFGSAIRDTLTFNLLPQN